MTHWALAGLPFGIARDQGAPPIRSEMKPLLFEARERLAPKPKKRAK